MSRNWKIIIMTAVLVLGAAVLLLVPKTQKFENFLATEPAPKVIVPAAPTTILLGGDIFLDRSVRRQIEANGNDPSFPWVNIQDFLKSMPYKIANLEGPVMNKPQAAPTGSFSFSFQEDYVKKLSDLGFTALSLANNHSFN